MSTNYELATSDHVPLSLSVNLANLRTLSFLSNDVHVGEIDWSNLTEEDLVKYYVQPDILMCNINLLKDAAVCCDINCEESTAPYGVVCLV